MPDRRKSSSRKAAILPLLAAFSASADEIVRMQSLLYLLDAQRLSPAILAKMRVAAFLIFGVGFCAFAHSPREPRKPLPPQPAKWEPKAQEIFVSYWTVEPNWSTQLEIRNNVTSREVTVTPVLRTAAGAEIELKAVTVAPNAIADGDVREALATAAPELMDRPGSFGSAVYRFNANDRANIFVANTVQRTGTAIGYHFDEAEMDTGNHSDVLEGIWWLPRFTASDWLILANASSQPVVASLLISDGAGRTFQQKLAFSPAQTQRLDLREITQAARFAGVSGGVRVAAKSGARET